MPQPNGSWFISQSARRASIGGSAAAAHPAWFFTGPSVNFGHMPPKKGRGRK